MSHELADQFIAELESTIQNFEQKRNHDPSLSPLLDVTAHMVQALGALKSNLPGSQSSTA